MKKVFKMAIIAIAVVTMSMAAQAQQKGDMAAGANLAIGIGNHYTNVGITGKFQYNVINPLRLEGSLTFFPKKDYVSFWDVSVNAHYLFPIAERFTIYPLAGLGIFGSKMNYIGHYSELGSSSSTDVCFNIGGGVDFKLTEKLFLNAELKYKIVKHWDRFMISFGAGYKF